MEPTIYNVTMVAGNTEYSLAMPSNAKGFIIKTRTGADTLKLALKPTESGTNYITVPVGSTLELVEGYLSGKTIYFQSATPDVVEVIVII